MKEASERRRICGMSVACIAMISSTARLDAKEQAATNEAEPVQLEEVLVTGTHIKGVAIDGILPISVISNEDVQAIAPDSGAELLTTMAQVDISTYQDMDTVDRASIQAGRGDVKSVNLRGLGASNTLVLLNGRRVIQHPGTQFDGNIITTTVNANTIPSRGVQGVEVLSDGASALYGSDAAAGVVNTVLMRDFDGLTFSTTYGGGTSDAPQERRTISVLAGKDFNEGRTNVSLSLNHFKQDGYLATERDFSASEDLRPLFEGTRWEGDVQLDNRATYTPWGVFNVLGRRRVTGANGALITSNTGQFHIQPATMEGCRAALPDGMCIDDAGLNRELYLDSNPMRSMEPDIERINAFSFINHEFDSGLEFFGEFGFYRGVLERQQEQGWFAPSTTFTVSRNAYWNPFGRMFLANGQPNPNRLPGINAPAEGLDIGIGAYRALDTPATVYEVTNNTYRALAGLRGDLGAWSWESAILWSAADTTDVTNGISNTAFFEAVNRTDATAYNPFNGLCLDDLNGLNGIDCTPSPAQTIEGMMITSYRKNEAELALADFRLSRGDLWRMPGGPVGLALGAEARYHRSAEDRDPRMDGTITYTDTITGVVSDSDLLGISATPDFSGSRNVYSVFAELFVPLVGPDMNIPLVQSLNMQLAGRFEDYDDVGSVAKPKIALGWHVVDSLQIRGSYTEGFTAPALEVVNAPKIIRSSGGIVDTYRCQAGVNNGLYADIGACGLGYGVLTPYVGNTQIGPEEHESYAYGIVWSPPFINDLVLTINRWRIKQEGIFGGLGVQDTVELDWATRLTAGQGYGLVERAPVTQEDIDFYAGSGLEPAGVMQSVIRQFLNLETRESKGIDIGVNYALRNVEMFGADLGAFEFNLSGSYIETVYQDFTPALQLIREVSEQTNSSITVTAAGEFRQVNRLPKWRSTATINWRRDNWRAGVFATYSSTVYDTGLELDGPELEYWRYMVGTKVNAHIDYTFRDGLLGGLSVRLGAKNLLNRDPPLSDGTFGYAAAMSDSEGRYIYGQVTYSL